ncbi:MAG: STN domain-containing protein, partial [Hyphomonas sp.]|nr:STN domain-containing protein [Hyphomonas sp.]
MGYTDNRKRGLLGAAALSAFIWLGAGAAAAEPGGGGIELQIEAGPLGDVLRTISLRTGTPVIFSEELVAGRRAPALSGTYAGADAVRAVLAGSGLVATEGRGGGLRIEEAPARPETPEVLSARPADRAEAQGAAEVDLRFDQVTVTGTSLRGFAPESSPLLVFGRDEILRSGVATAEEFIRKLPQNFGGGSSEFVPAGLPN